MYDQNCYIVLRTKKHHEIKNLEKKTKTKVIAKESWNSIDYCYNAKQTLNVTHKKKQKRKKKRLLTLNQKADEFTVELLWQQQQEHLVLIPLFSRNFGFVSVFSSKIMHLILFLVLKSLANSQNASTICIFVVSLSFSFSHTRKRKKKWKKQKEFETQNLTDKTKSLSVRKSHANAMYF